MMIFPVSIFVAISLNSAQRLTRHLLIRNVTWWHSSWTVKIKNKKRRRRHRCHLDWLGLKETKKVCKPWRKIPRKYRNKSQISIWHVKIIILHLAHLNNNGTCCCIFNYLLFMSQRYFESFSHPGYRHLVASCGLGFTSGDRPDLWFGLFRLSQIFKSFFL
jgi:hypothetical protein